MTNSQSVSKQRLRNPEVADFCEFCKTHKKDQVSENLNSQRREDLNSQKRESKIPARQPTPIHKLRMKSVVCNTSIGHLGYPSGYAHAQLLLTCSLAEYVKLEKILGFIATTKNLSVVNILLLLNPKHSSY